jgi:peptidyl-prolyl cis-trans isomerase D
MGILEKMRSGQDSTFMQVVMGLIIVSFVGFMGQGGGDKGSNVAIVNGVPITDIAFSRMYRMEARNREAQRGPLSDSEQQQLVEVVRSSLVEQEVLTQEARRLGVEVSDSEVARALLQVPAFRGENGVFDEATYLKKVSQEGTTQDEFEQRVRDQLLRDKLRQLVFLGASSSEAALRTAWIEDGTTVDLTVVRIRPQALEKDLVITDELRATWKTENEAAPREAYERDKARLYDHPEQARVRMIRLAVTPGGPDIAARLESVRAQVAAGGDMEALARAWSEDPSALRGGDLGAKPVGQLAPEIAAAITDLQPGGLSAVLTSATDVRFVRLEERIPAKVDPFEEVEQAIVDRLIREEKLPGLARDFAEQQLLPKWQELGAPPEALLSERGLSARPTGPLRMKDPGPLAPPAAALEAARTAAVGAVLPKVYDEGGMLYVVQVGQRVEPDPAAFDADKGRLREELLLGRRSEFYQAWVTDLKAAAKIEMLESVRN